MSKLIRMELKLELKKEWVDNRPSGTKPPIVEFIEAFNKSQENVEIKKQEAYECTLITQCEEDCEDDIFRLANKIMDEDLNIREADKAAKVTVSPLEEEKGDDAYKRLFKKIDLEFTDKWVLFHRDDDVLPIDEFLANYQKMYGAVRIISKGLTTCSFIAVGDILRDFYEEAYLIIEDMKAIDGIERIEIEDASAEAEKEEDKAAEARADKIENKRALTAAEKIEGLIGAENFKALARELCLVAPQIIRHNTRESFSFQSYLFSIGDSCGISTYLELFAELVEELKLFDFSSGNMVEELSEDKKLEEMLEAANGCGVSRQVICLDISEWMDKTRTREFRLFLKKLQYYSRNQLFVFRIPFVDETTRQSVLRGLGDILFVREVVFPPFSQEELKSYAEGVLEGHGFRMTEDSWQVFDERIIEEKSDGRFYGLNTVKKVVDEIIYRKHLNDVTVKTPPEKELLIDYREIESIASKSDTTGSALEQLDKLIGMEPVRDRIMEVLAQIELAKKESGIGRPCLHMRFIGNPGTGKTTVARILGRLLKEREVLSKGQFFEYAARDFCGQYIGETAPRTAAMCRDAYGSIMFIDEAYSLYRGMDAKNDYGREAIDTLIAQMENHRSDFIVIMAGYPEDMDMLMSANSGLASRMPYTIEFPNYRTDELFRIFMSMVKGKFAYEPGFEGAVNEYFASLSEETLLSKEFSNARFVRNLFERTWGKAAIRRQLAPDEDFKLIECDFDKAVAEREFSQLQGRKQRRIGF